MSRSPARFPGNGKCVTILTADGWSVTLTQLGSIAVTKGASVVEGDGVGTIGPSGEPGVSDPYVQLGIRHADQYRATSTRTTMLPSRPADPAPATLASTGSGGSGVGGARSGPGCRAGRRARSGPRRLCRARSGRCNRPGRRAAARPVRPSSPVRRRLRPVCAC